MLQDRLGLSERRACRIAGQNRSTQRHCPQVTLEDQALRARLRKISERPRWATAAPTATCARKASR
jgi:hypothetical protein